MLLKGIGNKDHRNLIRQPNGRSVPRRQWFFCAPGGNHRYSGTKLFLSYWDSYFGKKQSNICGVASCYGIGQSAPPGYFNRLNSSIGKAWTCCLRGCLRYPSHEKFASWKIKRSMAFAPSKTSSSETSTTDGFIAASKLVRHRHRRLAFARVFLTKNRLDMPDSSILLLTTSHGCALTCADPIGHSKRKGKGTDVNWTYSQLSTIKLILPGG